MPSKKSFLFSIVCFFLITTLEAQVTLKYIPLTDVVKADHEEKRWEVKQILKDSLSFKYIPCDHFSRCLSISKISLISIFFTEIPVYIHLSVTEKLQSHLKKKYAFIHQ